MRKLVHGIKTHMEMVDLEVTSNLHAAKDGQGQTLSAEQPTKSAPAQHANNIVQLPSTDPSI